MSARILDGKLLAGKLQAEIKEQVEADFSRGFARPLLATILVGDDAASATYVEMKGRACARAGMGSRKIVLPASTSQKELIEVIDGLNEDAQVNGILLQHPIPGHLDERAAFDRIAPGKDVDGVGALNFGLIALGEPAFACCTPAGIMTLLAHYELDLSGLDALVIGRSPILGKPMAMMLLNQNCTVTIAHSRTRSLPDLVSRSDLVVAAVGRPRFVQGSWIKEGAIVIDAGYNAGNVGDCDTGACAERAGWITPVPGGVGPMTIATLLGNTLRAAQNSRK
ncbi:MAG: bifunctional 5,10-methylenetetrahydrofolate dehydrogenase/5,10-methenyltetrahydrofolate cyclohydrolase [Spirochaetales bacterium]|nr:bifunctional 5,10-methylenetetrahydrofolate dehydrogenase/5,10-methenyltetrahydrofolate cyclohydrolase [Spirochaetales bacterium]